MIEAFYGPEWMGTGLIIDQGGSFLTLCLVGIPLSFATLAGWYWVLELF